MCFHFLQNVISLAAEGDARVRFLLKDLYAEGIDPSISGDIWSDRHVSLFGILVHFIDKDFKLHEFLCGAIPFSGEAHTGANMSVATNISLMNMGIGREATDTIPGINPKDAIHAKVSDNGSNMKVAWNEFHGGYCACHTAKLCVDVFVNHPAVAGTFIKAQKTAQHFNKSVKAADKLKSLQTRLKIPTSKPPQGNNQRWTASYERGMWFLKNQSPMQHYEVEHPKTCVSNDDGSVFKDFKFSMDDWTINEQTTAVLRPLSEFSVQLEGSTYVTQSLIIPLVNFVLAELKEDAPLQLLGGIVLPPEDIHKDVRSARSALCNAFRKRFVTELPDAVEEDLMVTTCLDPRFKNYEFQGTTLAQKEKARGYLHAAWLSDWKPPSTTIEVDVRTETPEDDPTSIRPARSLSTCLSGSRTLPRASMEMDELRTYLHLPEETDMEADVFTWWRRRASDFPNLSRMARQFLAVPASSAGVERLFSMAGRIFSDLRKSTKEETLEYILRASVNTL